MELNYGSPQFEEVTVTSLEFLRERIFDEHADYSTEGRGVATLALKSSYARSLGYCEDPTASDNDRHEEMSPPEEMKLKLADLQPGMALEGTVVNVVDFGVFVDIGLKELALV